MRLYLLAAILALLPLPALADVTARYSAGKDVLLVESDDAGNSRIGIEGKFGIIRRDGHDYAVMTMSTGETKVAELSGLLSLMSTAMAGKAKAAAQDDAPEMKFVLVTKGEAAVGTRKGAVWSFGPEVGLEGKAEKQLEFVMTGDPDLAPIGAIFGRTVETLLPLLNAVMPGTADFGPKAIELMAKGAALRIDKVIELQSIDTAEIDAKRFELPAPLVEPTEFMMAMAPSGAAEGFKPLP